MYLRILSLPLTFLALPSLACDSAALDSSRIAIAGGSLTEIVYFLGAEERIIATDRTSNYPEEALSFPSVGYVRNLSTEGLLSLEPTLVLGEHDMGPPEVLEQLALTGVEIVRVPERHSAAGILDKLRCVATILDLQATAERRIGEDLADTLAALEAIAANGPGDAPRVGVLLGIRDGQPLAAGRDTSGHGIVEMAGADNVFAALEGWKPASMESMVRFDPEYLILPTRGIEAAGGIDGLLEHPAVRLTSAARSRRIIGVDGMTLLGFGPRTLGAALDLAEQLGTLPRTGDDQPGADAGP